MTPPFLRSLGRPHGADLGSGGSRLGEIRISPELRRLSEVVTRSRDLASVRGRDSLAGILPNCAGNPACSPDLSLLPAAITQGLAAAERNPALYRMVLNFLAAQLLSTTDLAAQEAIRSRAREIARTALTAISNPAFAPSAEDAQHMDEPVRTKTRMLFDITCTLSAILAQPNRESYSDEDRTLLQNYFHQILSGMEQTRIRSAINPNNPPFPEYFERFVRAQVAILDNDREAAFRQLLATRALFQDMPAERRELALPRLVETSTELALQSMPRDPAGEHVETLRSLISLETLGYFYQVDFSLAHPESEMPTAQRHTAALNLVASVYLNAGTGVANAGALIEQLAELGENRRTLRDALQQRYDADEAFRRSISGLYSGDLGNAERRGEVFDQILNEAERVARHIHGHRGDEPYSIVLSRDREGRQLQRALRALRDNGELLSDLRTRLGLAADAEAEIVARQLCEMGELLPVFLESLPELDRMAPANRPFFDAIRNAARGYRDDGMRTNVEGPLLDLIESMNERARTDDRYAPAYHAFFQSLHGLEQIAPDATLSPALRQTAQRYAEALGNFSWSRVGRRLAAPESLGMLLGGIVLTELAPIWLLRGARIPFLRGAEAATAVRTSGEMGVFVRGGQLTWQSELAIGAGIGLMMQAGGTTMHMAFNRAPGVGIGQEFDRIGLSSLAWGTVFSMAAMGGTILGGRLLRRGLLPEGATLSPGRLAMGHLGMRLGNWTIGGGLMIGAHSATAALTGHSAAPSLENVAEIFLTMALWDATAAGLRFGISRTSLWRHQVGPFRARQMLTHNLEAMIRRAPELAAERAFLESYLQSQIGSPRRFSEITRSLERGMIPRLEGTGTARRLIFTAAPLSADAPLTRTGAARAILQLEPEQAAEVRRLLDSDAFTGHPEGIGRIRQLIRQRLANGERRPRVWVRAYLEGNGLRFEILSGRPGDGDRENTFQMDPGGVRLLQTEDPVLRAVMAGYQNEMFTPILPPSAGHSVRPAASPTASEDATAAHRAPPAETPAAAPTASGSGADESVPPPPAEPAAESVPPPPPPPVETAASESGARSRTGASSPEPEAAPALRPTDTAADSVLDPQTVTAPQQPTDALIEAARRTSPAAPSTPEGRTEGSVSRRGEEDRTVQFTTGMAARARRASRPEAPIEDITGGDPAATRRIPAEEARELRERLARHDGEPGAPPEEPAAASASRDSEAPIDVDESDFAELGASEAPPLPATAEADPFSFSDVMPTSGPPGPSAVPPPPPPPPPAALEGVTLRPPRVPADAPVLPPPLPGPARRGPPPLPRRPDPEALAGAIERDSESAVPILLLRRRLEGLRPTATRTAAVRIPAGDGYEPFATRMDRFFADLYAEVQQRAEAQAEFDRDLRAQNLPEQNLPYLNLFTVEVSPRGEMQLITGVENLRYQDHSYFTLRRRIPDPAQPERFVFVIEEPMNIPPAMEAEGWEAFLRSLFQ